MAVGTFEYMSPEQVRAEELDARTDLFSFGLVLYEMATGRHAFKGDSVGATLDAILNRAPLSPLRINPELPPELEHIINKALEKDREVRYQSASELRADLKRLKHETEAARAVAPVSPPAKTAAMRTSPLQRLALAGLALIALVAVLAALNVAGLRDRLLTGIGARSHPSGMPLPKIESLAVLPLANISGDPNQEYFADGMTDALIAELGQIGSLRVISRTSIMQYKGAKKPLPQIARELNVDALIEGSVLRSGDRIRVTTQLIGAVPERHLWARSYERDLRDVLTLQGEVARAIAEEVKAKMTPDVQARLATPRPVNPEAHEAYLKGRFFLNKLTKPDILKAVEYARQAVQIDPNYAAAYGLLAVSYWESGVWPLGDLPYKEALQKSRATATKALEIDDTLAEGHYMLGTVLYLDDWDWAGAEREFKRAIELNPSSGDAHGQYAWYLMAIQRRDESLREAKRALELDPVSGTTNYTVSQMYYLARQYDQSLEIARKWIEIDPSSPIAHWSLFLAYEEKGTYDEAIAAWQKSMTLGGEKAEDIAAVGHAYEVGGIRGFWKWRLHRELTAQQVDLREVARAYAQLGEKDKAFEWLEKMYGQRYIGMVFLKVHPKWDPLRSDPRFQDLLRRMNFPP
jgi:TolB-like protein